LPDIVREKVSYLVNNLSIPIGYHAHNNLGMGIANSVEAVRSGATIIDGSSRGFGAGAGNAQLEVIGAVFHELGFNTNIDLYKLLDASDIAEKYLLKEIPHIKSLSIVSGLSGVFSGFIKHVIRISEEFSVDPRDVFFELGKRKVVAGQEDLIIEVARDLVGNGVDNG
jgi:4-hydroxy 2-oxovalerate aldolase